MRRKFTPEFKVNVLIESFSKSKKIAVICKENKINQQQFYKWKNIFINSGKEGFLTQFNLENSLIYKNKITELIKNQNNVISKLYEINDVYKKILRIHGIGGKYKHYTLEEKREIILKIQNSKINKLQILRSLGICKSTYYTWKHDLEKNLDKCSTNNTYLYKYDNPKFKEAVFSILHSPPSDYGFNRTTWRMQDILITMKLKGLELGRNYITRIIKNAGFRFLKARKVLTSTDPKYREKLKQITEILSNLGQKEKFFSIDEYGPFAIKIKGGKSLVEKGKYKTYPQFQKSKGCLILTAALELSTNQVIHFYSTKKDTDEMIKLLEVLVEKYFDQECIYLSWDAASWHASKMLKEKVNEINTTGKLPIVKLAPLPASAQFLNIIESVFSGMARAIIHNSNYQSSQDCVMAINRYFKERNEYFKKNPKRAGNKLWGKERVEVKFSESNNCKDPKYLHNF